MAAAKVAPEVVSGASPRGRPGWALTQDSFANADARMPKVAGLKPNFEEANRHCESLRPKRMDVVRTSNETLGAEFSVGIQCWFVMLKDYAVLSCLFLLGSAYFFHVAARAYDDGDVRDDEMPGMSKYSQGNMLLGIRSAGTLDGQSEKGSRDVALILVLLDMFMMFAVLGMVGYHYWMNERIKDQVDLDTIALDDYSVRVYNLLRGTNLSEFSWIPFVFDGVYSDVTGEWHANVGYPFSQAALINAFSFPFPSMSEPLLWHMQRWALKSRMRTHLQLEKLYTPVKFLLSERCGQFLTVIFYTIMFSSSTPMLYVCMIIYLILQYYCDRVSLLRLCGTPVRYTGRLAHLAVEVIPWAVVVHFALGSYFFGQSDMPSYALNDDDLSNDDKEVDAWDTGSRLNRVNGLIPAISALTLGCILVGVKLTLLVRFMINPEVDDDEEEGLPKLAEAVRSGRIKGLRSYRLKDNPVYEDVVGALAQEVSDRLGGYEPEELVRADTPPLAAAQAEGADTSTGAEFQVSEAI